MKKNSKNLVFFGIVFSVFFFLSAVNKAKAMNSPIIIDASESSVQGKQELTVTGLTTSGTAVLIYVNNEFLGEASTKKENNLLDRFYFQKNITTAKPYKVGVVAREITTMELSSISNIATVSQSKPAVIQESTSPAATVPKPSQPESSKNTGAMPIKDNPTTPVEPSIADLSNGKTEDVNNTISGEEISIKQASAAASTTTEDAKRLEDKNRAILNIKEILSPDINKTASGSGLIDETLEKSGKLKLNLLIFIVFLIAIIAWIFWVNQELVKERRSANGETPEKDNDKEEK